MRYDDHLYRAAAAAERTGRRCEDRALPAAATAKKLTTYGQATFKIAAHGHKTISVHLSGGGKRVAAAHRSTKVWANVRLSTGASYAIRITLKH